MKHSFQIHIITGAIMLFAGFVVAPTAHAADATWDGGGVDNNWHTAENWDTDAVPGAGDIGYIDGGAGSTPIHISSNVASSIYLQDGYTGTLSINSNVTITGDVSQEAGRIEIQAGATINGSATINSSDAIFDTNGTNITFGQTSSVALYVDDSAQFLTDDGGGTITTKNDVTISNSATFDAPATLNFEGDDSTFEISSATFNHNDGTINFTNTSKSQTIETASTEEFYNVTVNLSGPDFSANDDFIVNGGFVVKGTLTLTNGERTGGNGTRDEILVDGGTLSVGSSFSGGDDWIRLTNNATGTLNGDTPKLEIDSGTTTVSTTLISINELQLDGGTFNGNQTYTIENATTVNGGTFTATNGASVIAWLEGDVSVAGGTFNNGAGTIVIHEDLAISGTYNDDNGTVRFYGPNASNVSFDGGSNGSRTFHNVIFEKNDLVIVTIASGDTMVIEDGGTLEVIDGKVNTGTVTIEDENDIDTTPANYDTFDGGSATLQCRSNNYSENFDNTDDTAGGDLCGASYVEEVKMRIDGRLDDVTIHHLIDDTVTSETDDVDTGTDTIKFYVIFDRRMDTSSNVTLSFNEGSSTVTSPHSCNWSSDEDLSDSGGGDANTDGIINDVCIITYDGVNVPAAEFTDIDVTTSGGDVFGATQTAPDYTESDLFSVDMHSGINITTLAVAGAATTPIGVKRGISVSTLAPVGAEQTEITLTFDTDMDNTQYTGSAPPITFFDSGVERTTAALGLSFSTGTWDTKRIYTAIYSTTDTNVEYEDLDIRVSGTSFETDSGGTYAEEETFDDKLHVDTVEPVVANVTWEEVDALGDIPDAYDDDNVISELNAELQNGDKRFKMTVNFTEGLGMDTGTDPTFTFNGALGGGTDNNTFTLDTGAAGSTWTTTTRYVAFFDVADVDINRTDLDIVISGAQDAVVNNTMTTDTTTDAIDIDTVAPEVSISPTPRHVSGPFTVRVTVSEAFDALGVAVANNNGTVSAPINVVGDSNSKDYTITPSVNNGSKFSVIINEDGATDKAGNKNDGITRGKYTLNAYYTLQNPGAVFGIVAPSTISFLIFDVGGGGSCTLTSGDIDSITNGTLAGIADDGGGVCNVTVTPGGPGPVVVNIDPPGGGDPLPITIVNFIGILCDDEEGEDGPLCIIREKEQCANSDSVVDPKTVDPGNGTKSFLVFVKDGSDYKLVLDFEMNLTTGAAEADRDFSNLTLVYHPTYGTIVKNAGKRSNGDSRSGLTRLTMTTIDTGAAFYDYCPGSISGTGCNYENREGIRTNRSGTDIGTSFGFSKPGDFVVASAVPYPNYQCNGATTNYWTATTLDLGSGGQEQDEDGGANVPDIQRWAFVFLAICCGYMFHVNREKILT